MPTYEFTCRSCKHHFEIFTSMSKKSAVTCPECKSGKLQETYCAFFVGGNVSRPAAGGSGCHGQCSSCSSHCGH